MTEQSTPSPEIADGEILRRVRAVLSDPLAVAKVAASLDPKAIMRGDIREAVLAAAAVILESGRFCDDIKNVPLGELWLTLVERPEDHKGDIDTSENLYFPAVPQEVLILSDDPATDTLRQFLRLRANFEGKEKKGKREAWITVRGTKERFRLWFIDRANDHNERFGDADWRDGQAEYEKAVAAWEKDGEWHIPVSQLIPVDAAQEPGPKMPPPPLPWQLIPWLRRAKGRFRKIRPLSREEIQMRREERQKGGKQKVSDKGVGTRRETKKVAIKSKQNPTRASRK